MLIFSELADLDFLQTLYQISEELMGIFLPAQPKLSKSTDTCLNTVFKLPTMEEGEHSLPFLLSCQSISNSQNMHHFFSVHLDVCVFSRKYPAIGSVWRITWVIALKKHVFPKFRNPDPILTFYISMFIMYINTHNPIFILFILNIIILSFLDIFEILIPILVLFLLLI